MRKYKKIIMIYILLCFVANIVSIKTISAVTNQKQAVIKMKEYKSKKTGKKGLVVKYSYSLPRIKGKSKAVKKINKSLKKGYEQSLDNKKSCFEYVKYTPPYPNETYLTTTDCKIKYNKKGYVSFAFENNWYAGGVYNTRIEGNTYNLKTGEELIISNVVSGSKKKVKQKIANEYIKEFNCPDVYDLIMDMKITDFEFYLEDGDVVVCFGPYELGRGNGHVSIKLEGNYE